MTLMDLDSAPWLRIVLGVACVALSRLNWCDSASIVLSNAAVLDISNLYGFCCRGGSEVERRVLMVDGRCSVLFVYVGGFVLGRM